MSSENQNSDDIGESEQAKPAQPLPEEKSAASRFREQVESKQSNVDDFEPEQELWSGGFSPKAMFGTWITTGLVTIGLLIAGIALAPVEFPDCLGDRGALMDHRWFDLRLSTSGPFTIS